MIDYYSNCSIESGTSWADFVSLIVAGIALIVSWISVRYSLITFIHSMLFEKAKDCNNVKFEYLPPFRFNEVSGIATSIVVAYQLFDLHAKKRNKLFLIWFPENTIKNGFYLSLSTSTRKLLAKETSFNKNNMAESTIPKDGLEVLNDQWKTCQIFLANQIQEYPCT